MCNKTVQNGLMLWRSEWTRIAARIAGLVEASRLFMGSSVADIDPHDCVRRFIMPEARGIYLALRRFRQGHADALPDDARRFLSKFLKDAEGIVPDAAGSADLGPVVVWQLFCTQFEYLLQDREQALISLTERAFDHLQRLIVADETVRARWEAAFDAGEVACEKLGGAHLAHHGIHPFKAQASGTARGACEATDLVYQEPVLELGEAVKGAEAFVLTEWKLVRSPAELQRKTKEAIAQAELYRAGTLSTLEIRTVRFIIVVTRHLLPSSFEREAGSGTYRRIIIRVSPMPASKTARAVARAGARRSRI